MRTVRERGETDSERRDEKRRDERGRDRFDHHAAGRHTSWPREFKKLGIDPVLIGHTSTSRDYRCVLPSSVRCLLTLLLYPPPTHSYPPPEHTHARTPPASHRCSPPLLASPHRSSIGCGGQLR